MNDHSQIVGELRVFLRSPDGPDQPRMAALASEYGAACAEANRRLNRCDSYLRQGLRSEAIHLARTEPDLLDLVAVLDFPERPEWDELARAHGWPQAPTLSIEAAQDLIEAYALEDPLRELLHQHRRLALARAPLAARLETIRKIAKLDPDNSIWAEDLRLLEKARVDLFEGDIRRASETLNAPALEAILAEVEGGGWLDRPPEPLIRSAKKAVARVKREVARRAKESVLDQLENAYTSGDIEAGRQLRRRLKALIEESPPVKKDPLKKRAKPLLEWLRWADHQSRNEHGYEQTLEELERALETGESRQRLAGLERSVLGFGRGLSLPLQAKLEARYRALDRSARRRHRLILLGVAAACVLLTMLVVWIKGEQARSRDIAQASSLADSALGSGQVQEARKVLDALEAAHPGVDDSPDLREMYDKVADAEGHESDRTARFSAEMLKAEEAPPTEPHPASLEAARSLARLPAEKARVAQLENSRQALIEHEIALADPQVLAILGEVSRKLQAYKDLVSVDPKSREASDAIVSLRGEVARLGAEAARASEGVRKQAKDLVLRFEESEAARITATEQGRMVDEMARKASHVRQIADIEEYVKAGERFVSKYPTSARARSVSRALEERPLWGAVVARSAMVRAWPAPVTALSPRVAAARKRQLTDYTAEYTELLEAGGLEEYRLYVEAIAREDPADEDSPGERLKRLFSNPLVRDIWRIETTTGKVHYALQKPTDDELGSQFESVISVDGRKKKVFVSRTNLPTVERAPQALLAARFLEAFAKRAGSPAAWDTVLLNSLQAIQDDSELDPIVKLSLLRGTARAAARGSYPLAEAIKVQLRRLDVARMNPNVAWMDPDNKGAESERRRAEEVLSQLPPFGPCGKTAEELRQRIEAAVTRVEYPIGLLVKDRGETWRCRTLVRVPPDADLSIITPPGRWKKVGKGAGVEGDIAIEARGIPDLLEGRLVFSNRPAD